jgi:hypothetical protein
VVGCTASDGDRKNAPLPRMSEADAQASAAAFAESLARSAGAPIEAGSIKPQFSDCIGEHDETADDHRFFLTYRAHSPLTRARQSEAARHVRDDLKQHGSEIDGFRDDASVEPAVVLEAYDPKRGFRVDLSGYRDPDELHIVVSTPCYLPPGAKQQQF